MIILYTLQEAADELGIQVRTARSWLKKGKLKAEHIDNDRRWFVRWEDVLKLKIEGKKNGNKA